MTAQKTCNIDLSCWNLTIPIGAEVIPTNKLNAGYQSPFFMRLPNGALRFRAPSRGEGIKSTPHSTYPRAEFRQTRENGDDKEANWKPSKNPQSMYAELSVDELPNSEKAIIGQIHGDSDHPPLKIQITGDTIYAQLRRKLNGPEDKPVLLKGYKLGQQISYRVAIYPDYTASIWVNGKLLIERYQFDAKSYAKDTWYWKAGVYSQEKVGGEGVGQATFYALEVSPGVYEVPSGEPETPAPTPAPGPEDEAARIENALRELLTAYLADAIKLQPARERLNTLSTEIKAVKAKDPKRGEELNGLARTVQGQLK